LPVLDGSLHPVARLLTPAKNDTAHKQNSKHEYHDYRQRGYHLTPAVFGSWTGRAWLLHSLRRLLRI
jgi:hypothetical protein